MITIKKFDEARENRVMDLQAEGINPTMYWAYERSREVNNILNFNDVIWDRDIPEIVKSCRELGIKEFTISCEFSGLISTLAEFEKHGVHMAGLTKVKLEHRDFETGEHAVASAIKMIVD